MENGRLRATPAARALAKRLAVDLFNVTGTGYKGRIHKDDIANFNYEEKTHVTPLARQIAELHNIDLKGVKGSGHRNKIMKDDLLQLISDPGLKARFMLNDFGEAQTVPKPPSPLASEHASAWDIALTSASASVSSSPSPSDPASASATDKPEVGVPQRGQAGAASTTSAPLAETETVKLTQMRKIIARRMSESYFGIPTFIQTWEIDMTELLALRKQLIGPILEKTGKKLTVTDIISLTVVKTLLKHKSINASLNPEGTEMTYHNYVNLGMAVGMDEGLLVPVVKNADKMSISEFVVALKDLTERTFSKKLLPDEQSGSTFTISHLGMFAVDEFTAIINQSNAAILSVASTKDKLVPINGEAVIRPVMKISLTCDHRIIDGLAASKFMADLKALMENPITLFI